MTMFLIFCYGHDILKIVGSTGISLFSDGTANHQDERYQINRRVSNILSGIDIGGIDIG